MAELSDYLKLGSEPVSPAAPAGGAVDFEEPFEQLKVELRKLDSVAQNPVKWDTVVELSAALLAKSKTFTIGSYLCLGLLETRGYAGLSAGLEICRDLIKNFWETGFPPPARVKGRVEPFAWLSERGGRAVEKQKGSSADLEAVKKSITVLNELSALLQEKLASNHPGFGDLSRALNERASSLEAKARPQPVPGAGPASAAAAAAPEDVFPAEISTVEQADAVFPKLQEALRQVADVLRAADPTDPRPYAFSRALVWGEILEPPPAEEGLTLVPGVSEDLKTAWENVLADESFSDLLEAAESFFGQTIFWLDLHRYSIKAMDGLGTDYARARAAVMGELKKFLGRLPELLELKFADETPFASEETKKWLRAEVLSGGAAAAEPAVPSAAVSEKLSETLKKAGELAKKKKVNEAVNLFQEGIKTAPEKREQFVWRLGLARFCLGAKLPQVAIPHLEQLEREIGRFSLDEWEPQLSLEALTLLYRAYQKAIDDGKAFPDAEEKAQKLFSRLCQLDPMLALNLGKK